MCLGRGSSCSLSRDRCGGRRGGMGNRLGENSGARGSATGFVACVGFVGSSRRFRVEDGTRYFRAFSSRFLTSVRAITAGGGGLPAGMTAECCRRGEGSS